MKEIKPNKEKMIRLGRLCINAQWSSDHTWQTTSKFGTRTIYLFSTQFVKPKENDITLFTMIAGPLSLSFGITKRAKRIFRWMKVW